MLLFLQGLFRGDAFIIKKSDGYDQLLSGGRVVVESNVGIRLFVQ
jgi:hypothetical protein